MMKLCKLYLNYAGYCMAKASHAVKGDRHVDIQFKALFGLIEHPDLGWILFDTGYTRRFYQATRSFPAKIYAWITRVMIDEKEEISTQLQEAGISPDDVKHVIISHFHADHIGGLKDFTKARFYCSRPAWQQVHDIPDMMAFSRGILKKLIPDDFPDRVNFIEDISGKRADEVFGTVYDLFGDNSVIAFHVPGHAAGQIGIKLQTSRQIYLMVADACWDKRAYRELALPHPLVRLFFHSWKEYRKSVLMLKKYHERYPDHQILPTHCSVTTDRLVSPGIDMNVL